MRPIDADALRPTKIVERKRVFKYGRIRMEAVCTDVYRKNEIDNAPTIKPETEALVRVVERLEKEKANCQHYDKDGKWHYEETARKNGIIQAIEIVKEELN